MVDRNAGPAVLKHTKATRNDWLRIALETLINDGVEHVKVLTLANRLAVSRSSFYWYFSSRRDLLDQLLLKWQETNTRAIVSRVERPAETLAQAILNVFECWVDDRIFDPRLDFAVREWARRSDEVRQAVQEADDERVAALKAMYARYGLDAVDAFVEARIIYFMQLGYYAIEKQETLEDRVALLVPYVKAFGGGAVTTVDRDAFLLFARSRSRSTPPYDDWMAARSAVLLGAG